MKPEAWSGLGAPSHHTAEAGSHTSSGTGDLPRPHLNRGFFPEESVISSYMVEQPEAILRECRKKLGAELTCVEPPSISLLLLHCLVVLWNQSCPLLRSSTRKFGQRDPVSVFPVGSLISSLLPRQPIACKSSIVSN